MTLGDKLPSITKYREFINWAVNKFGITEEEARNKYGLYTICEWKKFKNSLSETLWNVYDEEIDEYQKGYSEKDITELLKHICKDEPERKNLYKFDFGTDEEFDYWDMCKKFGLKEYKVTGYVLAEDEFDAKEQLDFGTVEGC